MSPFSKKSPVAMIVNLVLELDRYKKENAKLKADNECLKSLLQTKQVFEVRG